MAPKEALSLTISGGTPPYTQPRWIGVAPTFLTVTVESPDTLRISPKSTSKDEDFKSNASFSFDIYDALGKHLETPLTIKAVEAH